MRNPALEPLDVLVGEWSLALTDAWFLESRDVQRHGRVTARWLGDAFIELEAELEGEPMVSERGAVREAICASKPRWWHRQSSASPQ